jgi:hypothetical protein
MHGDFASVGTIALSIEVPFIFDRPDPHALCVHEFFSGRKHALGLAWVNTQNTPVAGARLSRGSDGDADDGGRA